MSGREHIFCAINVRSDTSERIANDHTNADGSSEVIHDLTVRHESINQSSVENTPLHNVTPQIALAPR